MSELSVLLAPEGETLWIRRPEILLLTDQAYIDQQDYERIISRAGRSILDSQSAALLEGYLNEGYVKLFDYRFALPKNTRRNVFDLSKEVIKSMTFEERKQAGIYGHTQFANYLGSKLEHLNPGEPLFERSAAARRKLFVNIEKLESLKVQEEDYPAHVEEMQRRAIAKWLAAEAIAHKLNADFVFDLDEYRPYAKKIRENIATANYPLATKSIFSIDSQVPLNVMWEVISTQLPVLNIENTDDLLRFRPSRKEFEIFRNILHEMVDFYQEVNDEKILRNHTRIKILDAIDNIQCKMNTKAMKIRRYLPTCLSYLLKKFFIPTEDKTISGRVEKAQAKELLSTVNNPYEKLCCFSKYATRKPIPALDKNESDDGRHHWVTGAPLSWYEAD